MAESDAVWLSATAAALVTIVLTATSMLPSRRSAAPIDRLVAERAAADQRLKDDQIRTQRRAARQGWREAPSDRPCGRNIPPRSRVTTARVAETLDPSAEAAASGPARR